jgi:hypothetical protein
MEGRWRQVLEHVLPSFIPTLEGIIWAMSFQLGFTTQQQTMILGHSHATKSHYLDLDLGLGLGLGLGSDA